MKNANTIFFYISEAHFSKPFLFSFHLYPSTTPDQVLEQMPESNAAAVIGFHP